MSIDESLMNEIEQQEEDIFDELGSYDFQNPPGFKTVQDLVKNKARQQLAVSTDSPFSKHDWKDEEELRRLKENGAAKLREETREIRRQLDIVKSRLNELKTNKNDNATTKTSDDTKSKQQPTITRQQPMCTTYQASNSAHVSSTSKLLHKHDDTTKPTKTTKLEHQFEAKFRPLTGKTDCPNCTCDRRSSVCEQCVDFTLVPQKSKFITRSMKNIPSTLNQTIDRSASRTSSLDNNNTQIKQSTNRRIHDDDRPIRPARERCLARVETSVVDDVVVPGKVYTISRSLNEKRTKLAQAIDDLQLVMNQVKERGNKLNQERKLVQLYKDQWKYGPSIGGQKASSRDRLGPARQNRNYESRHDPNLSRDTKSLMGFQHIESAMKLRQYGSSSQVNKRVPATTAKSHTQVTQSRSKSLESLKMAQSPAKSTNKNDSLHKTMTNFHNGKSSSEINLASLANNSTIEEGQEGDGSREEIEEESDEVVVVDVDAAEQDDAGATLSNKQPSQVPSDNSLCEDQRVRKKATLSDDAGSKKESVQRMTWVPVFGETEVKSVSKVVPKRKLKVVEPTQSRSIDSSLINQKVKTPTQTSIARPKSSYRVGTRGSTSDNNVNTSARTDRIMIEAKRKLNFASDLMEQEHSDSRNKNQLTITRATPVSKPINRQLGKKNPSKSNGPNSQESYGTEDSSIKEIARLEEMLNEQQKLLAKLAQQSEDNQHSQQLPSPITVCCSNTRCRHRQTSPGRTLSSNTPPIRIVTGGIGGTVTTSKLLINTLRDRLNRTKLRLAQTLEDERKKHQQLKLKVDSSLRKQSDLENENELLKQSLGKCIDTCLKDISSTFESLSDTLNDSIANLNKQPPLEETHEGESGGSLIDNSSVLTNAAQLITDNRHLKQMKNHIESIERQRKNIFDELSKEKQRSNQLELQLKESQNEMNLLVDAKQRLEQQLALVADEQQGQSSTNKSRQQTGQHQIAIIQQATGSSSTPEVLDCPQASTSNINSTSDHITAPTTPKFSTTVTNHQQQNSETDKSDLDDTYSSVDVYRRYIQSISPDIESIRRERKLILSEFDNIKKMLSSVDK